jgi:hypothetical protein
MPRQAWTRRKPPPAPLPPRVCPTCDEEFVPVQRVGGSKQKYCSPECRTGFHSMARSFVREAVDSLGFKGASRAIMAYHDNPSLMPNGRDAPEPVADFREKPFLAPTSEPERPDLGAILHPKLPTEAPV